MKINLRKAAALVTEVRSAAKNIDTETVFSANLYSDNIRENASAKREMLLANIARRDQLEGVATGLRGLIGRANAESGINDLLSEDAYLEASETRLRGYIGTTPQEDWSTFNNMVAARKTSATSAPSRGIYGSFDSTTSVSLLTSSDIQKFNEQLTATRRRRREIKDRTVEINVRTEIEVSSEAETILRQEGLI
jgi:hypothetical protein